MCHTIPFECINLAPPFPSEQMLEGSDALELPGSNISIGDSVKMEMEKMLAGVDDSENFLHTASIRWISLPGSEPG